MSPIKEAQGAQEAYDKLKSVHEQLKSDHIELQESHAHLLMDVKSMMRLGERILNDYRDK